MKESEPYSEIFTEDLVSAVVEEGLHAPFEGCREIVSRGKPAIGYLLDYLEDNYWDYEAEGDGYAPIISLCLLASMRAHGLSERILEAIDYHYDDLDCMGDYVPSIIADLCEDSLEALHKALLDHTIDSGVRMDIVWALEILAVRNEEMRAPIIGIIGDAIRLTKDNFVCAIAALAAVDLDARALGPVIDDAILHGRIDRKIVDTDELEFGLEDAQPSEYLPPLTFLRSSNLKRIMEEYEVDEQEDDPMLVLKQYYGNAKVNDPCPCGSGRKYKKCCLSLVVERKKWLPLEDSLRHSLKQYFDGDEFHDIVANALVAFREASGLEETFDDPILVDWLVHDYVIPGEKVSIIRKFAMDTWTSLSHDQRETLSNWLSATFIIVEVQAIRPGLGYIVQELFPNEGIFFVSETLSSLKLARYDVMLLRIYRIKELLRVSGGALVFPSSKKGDVVGKILEMHQEYRNNRTGKATQMQSEAKSKTSFMRERSARIIGELVRKRQERNIPTLVTPEGDPMIMIVRKFGISDRTAVMVRLASSPRLQRDENGGGVFTILNLFPENAGEETLADKPLIGDRVYGTVTVMDGYIEVSCMSERRMYAAISLLNDTLGLLMDHMITENTTGVEEAMADLEKHPEMRKKKEEIPGVQKIIDDYYMKWLDERIPALDGKTPREAAADPSLIGRLEDILKEFENNAARLRETPMPPISRMRSELGLGR